MTKKLILLVGLALSLQAQNNPSRLIFVSVIPSGSCGVSQALRYVIAGASAGMIYGCLLGTWANVGGVGGSTNFSALTGGTNTSAAMIVGAGSSLRTVDGIFGVPASTTLPATCTVGDAYMDTNATSGARWYLCESTNTWAVQGATAPGGSTTQIQYNNAGAFGGDANLTWDATTGLFVGKPLGINTAAPTAIESADGIGLGIVSDEGAGGTTPPFGVIGLRVASPNGYSPTLGFYFSEGTIASPMEATNGFTVGEIAFKFWDGMAWSSASSYIRSAVTTGATSRLIFAAGGGTQQMILTPLNSGKLQVLGASLIIGPAEVGDLPTCDSALNGGQRFVTDSNAVSFALGIGSVVAGGGTLDVPVFCDGTDWRIG